MWIYNVGFINEDNLDDETQLDLNEFNLDDYIDNLPVDEEEFDE